jgi:hypothetical protein
VTWGLTRRVASPTRGPIEVRFELAGMESRHVALDIFDVRGRRVRRLMEGQLSGGRYGLTWRGEDATGRVVAAGVYFVRLQAGTHAEVQKVVRLR